jgi:hypothetical protein
VNEIIIKQSGFVTGNALLNPIAYAGEMNSRTLTITHPTFENCYYQLLVKKHDYPYLLGIENGKIMFQPSLINVATKLECQFLAIRKNDNIDINSNNCDCQFSSSDDCSNTIWKSDVFKLTVAQGLNLNGLTPIPPYEQLVDIYNNISKAKLAVEKTKVENSQLLETINQKLDELERLNVNNKPNDNIPDVPDEPVTPPDGDCNCGCDCNDDNDEQFTTIRF